MRLCSSDRAWKKGSEAHLHLPTYLGEIVRPMVGTAWCINFASPGEAQFVHQAVPPIGRTISLTQVGVQRRPTYKVFLFWGGRVPLDLRFRGPLEEKSLVRAPKIDTPGAPGGVFDLKCAYCGHVRRCTYMLPKGGSHVHAEVEC